MSLRRFGVEIECGNNNTDGSQLKLAADLQKRPVISCLSIGHDGSGIEFRTKPLSGDKGFQHFKNTLNWLRQQGCWVSYADGMHVHHEAKDYWENKDLIPALAESWLLNIKHINSFVAKHRPGRTIVCPPLRETQVNAIKKDKGGRIPGGRGAINFHSLHSAQRTIELRLHEGTLDYTRAIPWVKFGQALIDEVARRGGALKAAKTREKFLTELSLEDEVITAILEKPKKDPTFIDKPKPWWWNE